MRTKKITRSKQETINAYMEALKDVKTRLARRQPTTIAFRQRRIGAVPMNLLQDIQQVEVDERYTRTVMRRYAKYWRSVRDAQKTSRKDKNVEKIYKALQIIKKLGKEQGVKRGSDIFGAYGIMKGYADVETPRRTYDDIMDVDVTIDYAEKVIKRMGANGYSDERKEDEKSAQGGEDSKHDEVEERYLHVLREIKARIEKRDKIDDLFDKYKVGVFPRAIINDITTRDIDYDYAREVMARKRKYVKDAIAERKKKPNKQRRRAKASYIETLVNYLTTIKKVGLVQGVTDGRDISGTYGIGMTYQVGIPKKAFYDIMQREIDSDYANVVRDRTLYGYDDEEDIYLATIDSLYDCLTKIKLHEVDVADKGGVVNRDYEYQVLREKGFSYTYTKNTFLDIVRRNVDYGYTREVYDRINEREEHKKELAEEKKERDEIINRAIARQTELNLQEDTTDTTENVEVVCESGSKKDLLTLSNRANELAKKCQELEYCLQSTKEELKRVYNELNGMI